MSTSRKPGKARRSDAGGTHELTPAGREACSLAATRHGVYAMVEAGCLPRCATCPATLRERCPQAGEHDACPLLAGFRESYLAETAKLGHLQPQDWPLVAEYAKTLTVLIRIDQILEAEGLEVPILREEGRPPVKPSVGEAYVKKVSAMGLHPLLAVRKEWSALALKQANELGLSPAGRKRLELGHDAGRKPPTLDEIAATYAEGVPQDAPSEEPADGQD